MNHSKLPSLFALTTLSLIAALPAQNRSASYALNYGLAEFGGSITASSYSRRTNLVGGGVDFGTGASLIQRVHVFGTSAESSAVIANYSVRKVPTGSAFPLFSQTKTGQFIRRIAGLTWSATSTANSTISATCEPGLVFGSAGVSQTVDVFGYAVAVRANATAGLTYGLTPNLVFDPVLVIANQPAPPPLSVGLTGFARGSATGSASAWLAVPVPFATVSAGVSSTMTFANTRADLNVAATWSGLTGGLTVAVNPITLRLAAIARVATPLGTLEHRQPIVDWSAGSHTHTFPVQ